MNYKIEIDNYSNDQSHCTLNAILMVVIEDYCKYG